MLTCAACGRLACREGSHDNLPKNCPMHDTAVMNSSLALYEEDGHGDFFGASAAVEAAGYCQWPRLREVGEFCRRMGYKRIGLAFCAGLKAEAEAIVRALTAFGLEVESIICKTGGFDKAVAGIPEKHYVIPGTIEPMCNPIAQAVFLNKAATEFNVVVGLCVGHDSLFYKYSDAPVTTLIAKDRVLAHNPIGAVYCARGYLSKKIAPGP